MREDNCSNDDISVASIGNENGGDQQQWWKSKIQLNNVEIIEW
jgi:hypothetical protein